MCSVGNNRNVSASTKVEKLADSPMQSGQSRSAPVCGCRELKEEE